MNPNIKKDSFIKRNAFYEVRKIGENPVLFMKNENDEYKDEKFYVLNEVSLFIWENLKETISFENLVNLISNFYAVEKEKLEIDLTKHINILLKKGLVELK